MHRMPIHVEQDVQNANWNPCAMAHSRSFADACNEILTTGADGECAAMPPSKGHRNFIILLPRESAGGSQTITLGNWLSPVSGIVVEYGIPGWRRDLVERDSINLTGQARAKGQPAPPAGRRRAD